jgi:uncharacterized protein YdeI (YjbR/CyaY-like superfamily)
MNTKVDWYFARNKKWQKEIETLRAIANSCGLNEELKWGCPCYTLNGTNIVLIHVFRDYCALLFFKGALLKDAGGLLIQQTENVQAARQLRFTGTNQIIKLRTTIKNYIKQAVDVEKKGLKVILKKTVEFALPAEFQHRLNEMPDLRNAFNSLTPGRQRAYLLHFSSAKQASTRQSRVDKYMKQILRGKGTDD